MISKRDHLFIIISNTFVRLLQGIVKNLYKILFLHCFVENYKSLIIYLNDITINKKCVACCSHSNRLYVIHSKAWWCVDLRVSRHYISLHEWGYWTTSLHFCFDVFSSLIFVDIHVRQNEELSMESISKSVKRRRLFRSRAGPSWLVYRLLGNTSINKCCKICMLTHVMSTNP